MKNILDNIEDSQPEEEEGNFQDNDNDYDDMGSNVAQINSGSCV